MECAVLLKCNRVLAGHTNMSLHAPLRDTACAMLACADIGKMHVAGHALCLLNVDICTCQTESGPDACSLDVPQFLLSTKFFACLELDDSRRVADATTTIRLAPHSILFQAGDDGSSGIFVVVQGCLGMFLPDGDGLAETNKLMPGESVGDLDVIDGAQPLHGSTKGMRDVQGCVWLIMHCMMCTAINILLSRMSMQAGPSRQRTHN